MTDQEYMRLAIELAKKGEGWTNPNPMVGAVIVKDGRIIGQGYHTRCGELHAERNAFKSLTESAEGATIYVTLEPCCHYGRTPPCTEAIIENKIARVVVGSRDPNPLVSGKGAALLREHGIEVVEDFLRDECDALNPIFFHYITTGRPYAAAKFAITLDGKIATKTGASKWVTNETSRAHSQTLRNKYAAIMVGINTILADDPALTCRIEGGKNPVRVVCDAKLRIPLDSQLCRTAKDVETIVACAYYSEAKAKQLEDLGVTVLTLSDGNGEVDINALMSELGRRKIDSILVEGGGVLHDACFRAGIYNHVYAYIAPKIFGGTKAKSAVAGGGVALPDECAKLTNPMITPLDGDLLIEYDVAGGYETCLQE